jgi:hypothetical protein
MGKERDRLIADLGGKPLPKNRTPEEVFREAEATYPGGLSPRLRRALDTVLRESVG